MSKLSKHNRYQKSKPAPTKALPALGVIAAKLGPAIKTFAVNNPETTKKTGGFIKDLLNKNKNKNSNNQEEVAVEQDFYSEKSGGDFSHLSAQAPFAMTSPFKKTKPDKDNVTVTSSVKGVSNQQTGNYDVENRDITLVAGSSNDPLNGQPNTEAGAVSATGEIDGMKITTTESETSLAQAEEGKNSKVNPSSGNVVPNPSKSSGNPYTAENAIKKSEGSSEPVIGNETRYGNMHNKHYWKNANAGKKYKFGPKKGEDKPEKWNKKNDNLWVRERPDEKEGEIRHTNPFTNKKTTAPVTDNKPATNNKPAAGDNSTNKPAASNSNSFSYSDNPDFKIPSSFTSDTKENKIRRATLKNQKKLQTAGGLNFVGYDSRATDGTGSIQAYINKDDIEKAKSLGYKPEEQNWKDGSVHYRIRTEATSGGYRPVGYKPSSNNVKANTKSKSGIVSGSGVSSTKVNNVQASNVKSNELMPIIGANTSRTKYIAKEAGLDNVIQTRDASNINYFNKSNAQITKINNSKIDKLNKKGDKIASKVEKGKMTKEQAVDKINKLSNVKTLALNPNEESTSNPSRKTNKSTKNKRLKVKNKKSPRVKKNKNKNKGLVSKKNKNPLFQT
jgi:hypothetical protein